MLAKYDAPQPGGAAASLIAGGAKLKAFPAGRDRRGLRGGATRSTTRSRPRTPTSRRSIDSVKAFRNEGYLWCQVAEYTYDTFMIRNRTKG